MEDPLAVLAQLQRQAPPTVPNAPTQRRQYREMMEDPRVVQQRLPHIVTVSPEDLVGAAAAADLPSYNEAMRSPPPYAAEAPPPPYTPN